MEVNSSQCTVPICYFITLERISFTHVPQELGYDRSFGQGEWHETSCPVRATSKGEKRPVLNNSGVFNSPS